MARTGTQISFYPTFSDFPPNGSTTMIYFDQSTWTFYYWDGSAYETSKDSKVPPFYYFI